MTHPCIEPVVGHVFWSAGCCCSCSWIVVLGVGYEDSPLDEGEAEATDRPVSACHAVGHAEGQHETHPAEHQSD